MKSFFCGLLIIFFVNSLFAGLEWKMKVDNVAKQKKQSYQIVQQFFAQNGNVRMDVLESDRKDELYDKDVYWIYRGKQDTMYIVNKKEKNYFEMPLDFIFRSLGAFGSLVKIEISDASQKIEKLPDEAVSGFNCQHFKIERQYVMKMKIVLIKKTLRIRTESEIWSTRDLAFKEIADNFRFKDLKTGWQDLDAMIQKEREFYAAIGFIVKKIEKTYEIDKKGREEESSVLTTQLLEIREKSLSADLFEIPAGYEKVAMPGSFKEE